MSESKPVVHTPTPTSDVSKRHIGVQISSDGLTVWVNDEERCLLRAQACQSVAVEDNRRSSVNSHEALVLAVKALLTMMDRGSQPKKLDEALTWRANDELARSLAESALALAEEQK